MARFALPALLALAALAAAPAAAGAACGSDARGDVRIVLFKEAGCGGAYVEVPFGENGDRPDFRRFRHSDGEEYDVDDNRESAVIAAGHCARFFRDPRYAGRGTKLLCGRGGDRRVSLPEGVSSMRACPLSAPTLCRRRALSGRAPLAGSIERFAYDRPGRFPAACSGGQLAGTRALADLIARRWRTGSLRLGYSCVEAGHGRADIHAEGRALDWRLDAGSAHDRAIGDAIVRWLLADDRSGNRHARARRMGVQEIAWNGRVWTAPRWRAGLRPIRSGHRRRDWIHIALTRAGAARATSWWR